MKIAVKDIKPNPFRPNLPFNQAKIKQLEANIKSTGFWDNILLRAVDEGYECAYGHHRLQAVKNVGIKEIDVPVKNLDDATMLKVMAQENMEDWDQSPIWPMEVVKTTYGFLQSGDGNKVITSDDLSEFLAWPSHRIMDAIANLRSTGDIPDHPESGQRSQPSIKKEIFEKLPTQKHAAEFRRAVQKTGASPRVQKEAVKKFAEKPAKQHEAISIIEQTQEKLGEKKPTPKSQIELRGDAFVYQNKLMSIINTLPKDPPRELTEQEYNVLRGLALIIIKRLRRFQNGTEEEN